MLCRNQEPGISLAGVLDSEFKDIQAMVDAANGHFNGCQQVMVILSAARSSSKSEAVSLHSEGWHQLEWFNNAWWKHVTIGYCGGSKIHCYARLANKFDTPLSATHRFDTITYKGGYSSVNWT